MINIEKMKDMVPKYMDLINSREELIKVLKDYEIAFANNLNYSIKIYKELKDVELKLQFKSNNDILKRYFYLNNSIKSISHDINELLKNSEEVKAFDIKVKPYVAIKHIRDDGYDVTNLETQETINLDEFDYNFKVLLIEMLKKNRSFIGYITRDDLPLLMTMLEANRYHRLDKYHKMGIEIAKAHMNDDSIKQTAIVDKVTNEMKMIDNKIPFIYDSNKIDHLWNELDESEKYLSDDECCIKYYEYIILFDNDIEEKYAEVESEYDKKMFIEAYFRLSKKIRNPLEKGDYVRCTTASPIINEEVLKRKYAKIK